jgi:hypothetical protein
MEVGGDPVLPSGGVTQRAVRGVGRLVSAATRRAPGRPELLVALPDRGRRALWRAP